MGNGLAWELRADILTMIGVENELLILAWIVGGIVAVSIYAKALAEVKKECLTVYRDWPDFVRSTLWIALVPLGLALTTGDYMTIVGKLLGLVVLGFGVVSFGRMVSGAFKYNSGAGCWLSLIARLEVSALCVFALVKLKEYIEEGLGENFGDDFRSVVKNVLIPLLVFTWAFKVLIRPMIGDGTRTVRNRVSEKEVMMSYWERLSIGIQNLMSKVHVGTSAEEYYAIGQSLYNGEGVKRDVNLAFECFLRAAKRGLPDAQYRVGMAYDSGDGVAKSKYHALQWYLKAAEKGHATAQMCVGYAYRNGEGCEEDVHLAFKWYLKAAKQDEDTAQNNLAMMYECGVGVQKNIEEARHWYKKAIVNGNAAASDNLKDMERKFNKPGKEKNDDSDNEDKEVSVPVAPSVACDVDLKSLVGLEPVKAAVTELRNFIAYQIECGKRGMPVVQVSNHCVFTGNPGTGKTTVARIIAKIYHEMGILKTSKVVEVDRSKVVGAYIGHTAKQMSKVIDEAMDGVLFIDEAYSLAEGGEKDFGREAVEVLLKRMDDNRHRLVVIVAGYTDEMHKFIDMNPGLKSRFTHYIDFPDYSAEELERIFISMCEKDKYICGDDVRAAVHKRMEGAVEKRDRTFGNARFVRNLYEDAQRRIASRLAGNLSALSDAELKTFAVSDVE